MRVTEYDVTCRVCGDAPVDRHRVCYRPACYEARHVRREPKPAPLSLADELADMRKRLAR